MAHLHLAPPNVPTFFELHGNPDFEPENMLAYEIGYRAAPTDTFTWDITAFINDYRKLRSFDMTQSPFVIPPGLTIVPAYIANGASAVSGGVEVSANMQLTEAWRLFGSYSLYEISAQSDDPLSVANYEGSTPNNQVYLRSSWDLSKSTEFDLMGRYVDRLVGMNIPSYFEVDARIGWHLRKNLEVSFAGFNLLDNHHPEFEDTYTGLSVTSIRRSWYGMLTWTY